MYRFHFETVISDGLHDENQNEDKDFNDATEIRKELNQSVHLAPMVHRILVSLHIGQVQIVLSARCLSGEVICRNCVLDVVEATCECGPAAWPIPLIM